MAVTTKGSNVHYVYALVACGLGIVGLWSARTTFRLRRKVLGWPTVRGHVTLRQTIQPTDRGRMSQPRFRWAPDVRYTYTVDGVEHTGDKTTLPWSQVGSKKRAEKVLARIPDETDVRYDPNDPKTSCLWAPGRGSVAAWATAGVVAIVLGAAYAA